MFAFIGGILPKSARRINLSHMIQTLFLDAAGTLLRTSEPVGAVYSRHFAAHGLALDPDLTSRAFGESFRASPAPDYEAHPDGDQAEEARWKSLVQSVLRSLGPEPAAFAETPDFNPAFAELYNSYAAPEQWALYDDTLPFLERAAPRYRLAVVSNFDHRLHEVLAGLGIASFFDHICTSGDAAAAKPDPSIFQRTLDALQADPATTVHAGDCPQADVMGAQAAGPPRLPSQPSRADPSRLPDFL